MKAEALIGTMLGTCTLQKLIGQGGMGAVFLAQQSRPRRQVAVKVLLPTTAHNAQQHAAFLERFRRETDAAALLEHPNIVPVHEYGERDGLAYLVMPYISGGTLRDEMEREGKFSLSKTMRYLDQIAAALDFAHQRGVVHRDIKPANILVTPEGRLLLTDFGLVKVIADSPQTGNARSPLTGVGVPLGTPDYMAPEQVIGGTVDARADQYSLAIILYQMLTGTTPFKGEMPMQIAVQHLHTPPTSLRTLRPDLPEDADQVVLRAMEKRASDRFEGVQELAEAFRIALVAAGVVLGETQSMPALQNTDMRAFKPRSLFHPVWQQGNKDVPPATEHELKQDKEPAEKKVVPAQEPVPMRPRKQDAGYRNDIVAKTSMTLPSFSGFMAPPGSSVPQVVKASISMQKPEQATPLPPSSLPEQSSRLRPFRATPLPPVPEQPTEGSTHNDTPPHHPQLGRKTSLLRPAGGNQPVPANPGMSQGGWPQAPAFPNPTANPGMSQGGWSQAPAFPTPPATPQTGYGMGAQQDNSLSQQGIPAPKASRPTGLLSSTGMFTSSLPAAASPAPSAMPASFAGNPAPAQPPQTSSEEDRQPRLTVPLGSSTTALAPYENQGQTNMLKLTQAVKVVKVPIAGQPGRYMTGLLPVLEEELPKASDEQQPEALSVLLKKNMKLVAVGALLVMVILVGSGIWLFSPHSGGQSTSQKNTTQVTKNGTAVNADATALANIILEDSLSSNYHDWPEKSNGNQIFIFKNGKYHIANNDDANVAVALLPNEMLPDQFVYTINLSEVNGDDTSVNNQIGLILRYNSGQKNGKKYSTFYCFEIQSSKDDLQYQFRKYDGTADTDNQWSTPWSAKVGGEYHFGHGDKSTNTFKVIANGGKYTFIVNGKQVGSFTDGAYKGGQIGMLVNLKGTEVQFSNLSLTHK